MNEKWYIKNSNGKTFGPITLEVLKDWVKDGRIEPLAGISKDLKTWMLAPLKAELEMNWVVENNPGQFYGPTHRNVIDDLVRSGSLSPSARFYCDDRGSSDSQLHDLQRFDLVFLLHFRRTEILHRRLSPCGMRQTQ